MKFFAFLINILFVYHTNCLYFYLSRGENRCFYDEFYSEVVVMMRFKILDTNISLMKKNENRVKISIEGIDNKKIAFRFKTEKIIGKFSQAIEKTGHYKICVTSDDDDLFAKKDKVKFQLSIDTDQDDFEETEGVVKNKDFDLVDQKMKKLVKKANEIDKMQQFQMETEDDFSNTQMDNSNRIVTMTICQIVIVMIIGLWQIFSLRKIFKEKAWMPF